MVNGMRYFKDCKSIEEVKEIFKKLAKELHPDNGGDAENFKQMMNEYTEAFNRLKNIHKNANSETYEKATSETPEQFADVINSIIHLQDVTIEMIGSWVWVEGNTYPYREHLKELHFFYSKNKKAWYYTGEDEKSRRKGRYTLDQIKEKYGVTEVETNQKVKAIA